MVVIATNARVAIAVCEAVAVVEKMSLIAVKLLWLK